MSSITTGKWLYMHDSAENCAVFATKLKATIRKSGNADMIALFTGKTIAGEKKKDANAAIYDEITL